MDIVLGVSMAPATIRMVLVEGESADGVTVDEDRFHVDNANDPATLYWFEARVSRDGLVSFEPHVIDNDSGIGTQFVVADINGDKLPDVVVSNKKGTFVFEQVRGGTKPAGR